MFVRTKLAVNTSRVRGPVSVIVIRSGYRKIRVNSYSKLFSPQMAKTTVNDTLDPTEDFHLQTDDKTMVVGLEWRTA